MLEKVKRIRLSDDDLDTLIFCFKKHFLKEDRLWIFGSRVDLDKRGGDIDLYAETYAIDPAVAIKMRNKFLCDLEDRIGEQKIDLVLNLINHPYPLPIHEIAKKKGIRII